MMYNTFNMGIGMVLAVDPADADKTIEALAKTGDQAWVIGEIAGRRKGRGVMLRLAVMVSRRRHKSSGDPRCD